MMLETVRCAALATGLLATSAGAVMANGPATEYARISGVFLGPGVECPQLRLADGEQISLTGAVPDADIGAALTLTGRWALMSVCMQGRTFDILPAVDEPEADQP